MVKKSNIFNNFNIPKKFKNSIILIGNFDGLHLGHQKLFQLAKKYKAKYKSKIGVVTFDPIPKMFLGILQKLKPERPSKSLYKKGQRTSTSRYSSTVCFFSSMSFHKIILFIPNISHSQFSAG